MTTRGGTAPAASPRSDAPGAAERETLRENARAIRRALGDLGGGTNFREDGGAARGVLDPVPLRIDAADWAAVGRALEQRAMVLELILDDLFGPQRLLAGGHLPTTAILTHREYLRQCVGIASPGAHRLVLYAADVARSADGRFAVLADRTQMPAGIGNAVQNREVMARVNPEALYESGVLPIEDWLATCRSALGSLAPGDVEQPRIVMMTPGPSAPTHAEQAYLARTLGFTLVEPSDLTVREAQVWLKSVAGLEPVHVIVRLVPSPDCDPLELSNDSAHGVAGLVEACRRHNVAVANPLGSGVGECAALLPYMPKLTRMLLGEDPLIESAPTWWCGDETSRSHVLANLDSLLIRSYDTVGGRHTQFGRNLSRHELDELAERIRAQPHRFVGQQEVEIVDRPSYDGDGVVERPTITRAFLVRDRDGYRAMDGGLTLTDDLAEAITFASYRTSKDTWVTSPEPPATTPQTVAHLAPVDLRSSITSRAAESMFWIGRNLERSHTVIRLVRSVGLMNETRYDLRETDEEHWERTVDELVGAVAGVGVPEADAAGHPVLLDTTELLTAALTDRMRSRSLATSLHYLLHNAESVRELFSADSWRLLGQIGDHQVRLGVNDPDGAAELAASAITPLLALSGLISDSMVRDPGWRFLDLGRRLEGASLVAISLGSALVDVPPDEIAAPFHETLLNTWDGLVAYRRRYRSDIDPVLLIDLLVTDESNPRSIRSQLSAMLADLEDLPGTAARRGEITDTLRTLATLVDTATPASLARVEHGTRPALRLFCDTVRATLDAVAVEIDLTYFVQIRSTNLFAELDPGPLVEERTDTPAPGAPMEAALP